MVFACDCLQSMCLLLYSSFSWHHYDNHLFAVGKRSTSYQKPITVHRQLEYAAHSSMSGYRSGYVLVSRSYFGSIYSNKCASTAVKSIFESDSSLAPWRQLAESPWHLNAPILLFISRFKSRNALRRNCRSLGCFREWSTSRAAVLWIIPSLTACPSFWGQ